MSVKNLISIRVQEGDLLKTGPGYLRLKPWNHRYIASEIRVPTHGEYILTITTTNLSRLKGVNVYGNDSDNFLIRDIRVNGRSQFISSHPFPANFFSITKEDLTELPVSAVNFDTCLPGQSIEIVLFNGGNTASALSCDLFLADAGEGQEPTVMVTM